MKASKVFREAAKKIELGYQNFCCNAISFVVVSDTFLQCEERDYFRKIYGKRNGGYLGWYGSTLKKENQDARIIALCLAAAIAESEGK